MLEAQGFDLAVLDLKMPGVDGVQLAKRLRQLRPAGETAILILSAVDNDQVVAHLLSHGMADDYLRKPFRPGEFAARVGMLLARRRLMDTGRPTEARRPAPADDSLRRTVAALAVAIGQAVDHREHGGDGRRVLRIAALSRGLALELGWGEEAAEELQLAALIHDLGRLAIPEGLLLRRDGLNARERALSRELESSATTWLAASPAGEPPPLIRRAVAAARGRHAHWDGSGFPDDMAGEAIPAEARIIAVARVLDALLGDSPARAGDGLAREAGRRLEPDLVTAAQRRLPALIETWKAATGENEPP
jgi:response regulator RpfG family c-di-GMP phosphodiesterase